MTGRRSLQTWTERMSRQTQFVPGHVGGRVASAQPVRRRATVGLVNPRPAMNPTGALITTHSASSGEAIALPSLAGYSSAVLLHTTRGHAGASPPSGFSELSSGTFGWTEGVYGPGKWMLSCVNAITGAESLSSDPGAEVGGTVQSNFCILARFVGGSGGAWSSVTGTPSNTRTCTFVAPPEGDGPWMQLGSLLSAGANETFPTSVGTLSSDGGGTCSVFTIPQLSVPYSGAAFIQAFITHAPQTGAFSTASTSWLAPATQPLAVRWA